MIVYKYLGNNITLRETIYDLNVSSVFICVKDENKYLGWQNTFSI